MRLTLRTVSILFFIFLGGTFMKQFLKTKSSHVINDAQAPLTENRKILWLAHQIDEKSGLYYEPIFI